MHTYPYESLKQYCGYLQGLLKQHGIPFTEPAQAPVQHKLSWATSVDSIGFGQTAKHYKQMLLPEVTAVGQCKLFNAKVLVVGCGGLGAIAALYLAGAGIGTIGLVDGDKVELSNLHRQVPHSGKVGQLKVQSLKQAILQLDSEIKVRTYNCYLPTSDLQARDYDIILDGTDNPASRYAANQLARCAGKTLVHGAALGWEGMVTVFTKDSLCYQCLYPQVGGTALTCAQNGVVGTIPGTIALLMATQTIKQILGCGDSLVGSMILYDGLRASFKKAKLRPKREDCICQDLPLLQAKSYEGICIKKQITKFQPKQNVSWAELEGLQANKYWLIDCRPRTQICAFALPNFQPFPLDQVKKLSAQQRNKLFSRRKEPIAVMCRRGNASRQFCDLMESMGRESANVVGGLQQLLNQSGVRLTL